LSIARSSLLFSAGTLLSRVVGLLRESVMASVFGAGLLMDAFQVAYRIPSLFRDMLAEGALGSSFTKVYSSLSHDQPERAQRLLVDSIVLVTLLAFCVSAMGIILAPWFVELMTMLGGGEERGPEFFHNATGLTRLLFPYLGLTMISAVVMGALHQRGRFFLSAASPVIWNVAIIFGALYFSRGLEAYAPVWLESLLADRAIMGLALGFLLGGVLQVAMQLWGIWAPLLRGRFRFPRKIPWSADVQLVVQIMIPAVVAASAPQISNVINTNFATSLEVGSVSWLSWAFRLLQFPVGLFGVAVGVATLPALSKAITAAGRRVDGKSSQILQDSCEIVAWLMMPCMVYLLVNAHHTIELLYHYGQFGEKDTVATAAALHAYAYGLLGYGLIKVFSTFYYAVERTSYAMKASLICVVFNVAVNFLLVPIFGHVGIAATASVVLTLNALLLMVGMRGYGLRIDGAKLRRSVGALAAASALSYGAQSLCQSGLAQLSWLMTLPVKAQAVFVLCANAAVVAVIFGVVGSLYFRASPTVVLRRILGRAK